MDTENGAICLLHPYDRVMNMEQLPELGKNADFIKASLLARAGERMRGGYQLMATTGQSKNYLFQLLHHPYKKAG